MGRSTRPYPLTFVNYRWRNRTEPLSQLEEASHGAPRSRATTIPPIIPERSPASSGTPDAIAIPIHIGSAPVENPVPANGSSSPVSSLQHEGCLFSHHPDRSFLNPCLHLHGQFRNVYIFPKALSWIILKLSRPFSGSTQFD